MSVSTENIQTTVSQLNREFAGRLNHDGYKPDNLIHIHRRNRAFVWNKQMQEKMLDSILKGYYVPPIISVQYVINNRVRREVMEGGNRITTFRMILTDKVRVLTPEERSRVESHPITLVVLQNLSSAEQREMFRRLNKNVKVSDGQLDAMSEDDSPLVKEAMAFLNDDDYPLRELITTHFFDTRNADNDGKKHLENAIALISGALYGRHSITRSFSHQEDNVNSQEAIPRARIVDTLRPVFDIFTRANEIESLTNKTKLRGQWSVGKWIGVMLYDVLANPSEIGAVQEKWVRYLVRVRRNKAGAEDATKLSGAQNLTATRYKRISTKVDIYLRDKRIAADEELNDISDPIAAAPESDVEEEEEDDE